MNHLPKTKRRRHPLESANFLSQLFFLYTTTFFRREYGRDLEDEDLHEVPLSLKSQKLADNFEELWRKYETNYENRTIIRVFLGSYGLCYFLLGISQVVVKTSLIIVRPFLVETFASFYSSNQTNINNIAGLYGFSIIILVLANCWYDQWYTFKLMNLGLQTRTTMTALFYRKILKLSSFSLKNTSTGKIITLITKDLNSIEICIRNANEIWSSIFQIFILFYVLFTRVGFLVFVAIFIAMLIPKQVCLALKCAAIKEKMLKETDSRLQTANDVLASLKVIKMYAWEKFFTLKLHDIRMNEMQLTHQIFFLKSVIYINGFVWTFATFFVLLTMFTAFGKGITSEFVFFIFDTYRNVGYLITIVIPLALCNFAQAAPTLKRINTFMSIKELPRYRRPRDSKIVMKEVKVTMKKEQILNGINLDLISGIVLVTGPMGCGKTVLLKTILGECELAKGKVVTEGTVSYASQKPWVFPGTLRQNIVFGEKFNQRRYNQVLAACDLDNDFFWFEHGDHTISTKLSNSQRVRINLARALYKDSDIYVLDDPLASLDSFMREHIINQCLANFFHNKLVVLVTQHTHLFTNCQTLVLDEGEASLSQQATHATIFKELTHSSRNHFESFEDDANEESKLLPTFSKKRINDCNLSGSVSCNVYNWWWQCGGGFTLFVIIVFLLFSIPVIMILIEESIFFWSTNEEKLANYTNIDFEAKVLLNQRRNIITLLIFLLLVLLIFTLCFSVAFLSFVKRASVRAHDIITKALLGVNLHFFNTTTGNVLNKFSKDLLNTDERVPFLFFNLFKMMVPMVSVLILIVQAQIIFLPLLALLFFILMTLRKIYVSVGRNFKRLEASSRSAVVEYFTTTMDGISTIKAQGSENKVQEEFETHLDLHISACFTYLCTTRAFCLAVGWISSIFFGIVVSRFLVVASVAVTVNLTLSQSLLLVEILSTIFLKWGELENYMTSPERLLQLTEIRQEQICGLEIKAWPTLGQIKFQNVFLTHDGLRRPVLKDINFTIKSTEKIGIVGRNTAGKSSLISALLGVTPFTGRISINGVDTKTLSLNALRSAISIIPKEYVIFKGTIRENLDPLNKHSNEELWKALEFVNLKKFIWDLNINIYDTYIVSNHCHKQKLEVARIILEKKSIVVLDDFLGNTDFETESLVLKSFETAFKECTVLVVTQNVKILSCCDRVMVLDEGKLVNFGSPLTLVSDHNELFYKLLCRESIT